MNKEIKYNIDCLKSHKFNFDYCLDELLNNFDYLQKQLEAYENMRKEARIFIKIHGHYDIEIGRITSELTDDELTDLLNILNKVGGNDEN